MIKTNRYLTSAERTVAWGLLHCHLWGNASQSLTQNEDLFKVLNYKIHIVFLQKMVSLEISLTSLLQNSSKCIVMMFII